MRGVSTTATKARAHRCQKNIASRAFPVTSICTASPPLCAHSHSLSSHLHLHLHPTPHTRDACRNAHTFFFCIVCHTLTSYIHTYMTCTSRMTWHHGSFIIIFITTTVMTGVMCHNNIRGSPSWSYFFVHVLLVTVTVTAEATVSGFRDCCCCCFYRSISAHIVASPLYS